MTNAEARFNKIHIRKVYACLAVTCHLHFWQNDLGLLRATAVTRGWNGYRNKSQHRKSTLEKKILPPFQQGFEPATFQSRVRCSNHWAIPAPSPTLHFVVVFNWKKKRKKKGRCGNYGGRGEQARQKIKSKKDHKAETKTLNKISLNSALLIFTNPTTQVERTSKT